MTLKSLLLSPLALMFLGTANAQEPAATRTPDNIISIAPLQVTDNGLGVGLSYERNIDKKRGLIAFYLPIAVAFDNANSSTGTGNYYSYYFMPGVKIYPTGNRGVVKYAVGPSLTIVSNKSDRQEPISYDQWGNPNAYKFTTVDHLLVGMMVNNSLNINPSEHLHMGLEFGLGFSYVNNDIDPYQTTKGFVQLGFKIGYRF